MMNNQKNDSLGSQSRRVFVAGSTVALSGTLAACAAGPATTPASDATIIASQHWAYKETPQGRVRLFAWRKVARGGGQKGALLFVHGSSMASTPVFDLQVPSRERSSGLSAAQAAEGPKAAEKRDPLGRVRAVGDLVSDVHHQYRIRTWRREPPRVRCP